MRSGAHRAGLSLAILGLAALPALAPACSTFNGLSAAGIDAAPASPDAAPDRSDVGETPDASAYPAYLSLDDAAQACSLIARCPELGDQLLAMLLVDLPPENYSLCVEWLAGPLPPSRLGLESQRKVLRCVALASSCAAADLCCSSRILDCATDPRCSDAGTHCEGNSLLTYRAGDDAGAWQESRCDSAASNSEATCLRTDAGDYTCAKAGCVSQDAVCVGNVLYGGCNGGTTEVIDCALFGVRCSGDSCLWGTCSRAVSGSACVGGAVEVCELNNGSSLFRCQDLSALCQQGPTHARCAPVGATCSSLDPDVNACTGAAVRLCVGGQSVSFDCSRIGQTCVPADSTHSGRCSP